MLGANYRSAQASSSVGPMDSAVVVTMVAEVAITSQAVNLTTSISASRYSSFICFTSFRIMYMQRDQEYTQGLIAKLIETPAQKYIIANNQEFKVILPQKKHNVQSFFYILTNKFRFCSITDVTMLKNYKQLCNHSIMSARPASDNGNVFASSTVLFS